MNLPKFSLTHKPLVFAIVLALFFLGTQTFLNISRREDPEIKIRNCVVLTQWPGAPAEKMEDLVSSPLEKVIKEINEVKTIRSSSRTGASIINVELVDSVDDVDQFWDEVRNKVEKVRLPKGCSRPFVDGDFGEIYVVVLNLFQTPAAGQESIERAYTPREMQLMAEAIEDEIKTLPAVGKTQLHGIQEEVIYLEVGSRDWAQLELTSQQLGTYLDQRNIVAPGGTLITEDGSFSVRPSGEFQNLEGAGDVLVDLIDQHVPVRLSDLDTMRIRRAYRDPPSDLIRFNSPQVKKAPSVSIAIAMKNGYNVVELGEQIADKLRQLKATQLPPDIGVERVNDLPRQVSTAVKSFSDNLWQGVLIVLFIAWLMMGWRPATVMATAVPITMIIAIATMPLFGIELERFSIASLIIALGMLVDNAIVISDNCVRLLNETGDRQLAMTQGAQELAIPVLTSTLTTVGVFFPMYLLPGNLGEYVRSLPLMVASTLMISYVVAMCVTPIMCTWLLRREPDAVSDEILEEKPAVTPTEAPVEDKPKETTEESTETVTEESTDESAEVAAEAPPAEPVIASKPSAKAASWLDTYESAARWCVDHPTITIVVALLMFIGSFQLPIGNEFFPPGYRDQFFIKIWLPEGASIRDTEKVCAQVEDILRDTSHDEAGQQRMVNMVSFVGYGGPRLLLTVNPEQHFPNHAYIVINTISPDVSKSWAQAVRAKVASIPGVRIEVKLADLGPAVDTPVEFRISGPSRERLRDFADKAVELMQRTPGTVNAKQNWNNDGYQVAIKIDDDAANLAGVTNADIASAMQELLSGGLMTTYREGDHSVDIMLRSRPRDRRELESLEGLFVSGRSGKVPLDALAEVIPTWQPAVIEHRNELRTVTVGCQVRDGFLANDLQTDLKPHIFELMKTEELSSSYRLEDGGTTEKSAEAQGHLGQAMIYGLIVVILVLITQYNSLLKPMVILTTLPLALIGARLGLFTTGWAMGFMASLGVVSLFGVVINNAIVLIDFIEQRVRGGQPLRQATVESGRIRLKPIVLTTLTTVGGLLPLGFFGGPLFAPMAWAMIFGLGVSTLLTLLFVPTVFVLFVEKLGMEV